MVVLLTTFLLTVLVDLTVAIQIGMVLAALLFMQRMSKASEVIAVESDMDTLEDYSDLPKGLRFMRLMAFFFAASQKYRKPLKTSVRRPMCSFCDAKCSFYRFHRDSQLPRNHKVLQAIDVKFNLSGVRPEVRKELEDNRLIFSLAGTIFVATTTRLRRRQ